MTEDSVINSEPTSDLFAVYATAKDVACAMAYIHSKGIIHGDLQGDALGLVSSSQDPRGFIVKVSIPLACPCFPLVVPFPPAFVPSKRTLTPVPCILTCCFQTLYSQQNTSSSLVLERQPTSTAATGLIRFRCYQAVKYMLQTSVSDQSVGQKSAGAPEVISGHHLQGTHQRGMLDMQLHVAMSHHAAMHALVW